MPTDAVIVSVADYPRSNRLLRALPGAARDSLRMHEWLESSAKSVTNGANRRCAFSTGALGCAREAGSRHWSRLPPPRRAVPTVRDAQNTPRIGPRPWCAVFACRQWV